MSLTTEEIIGGMYRAHRAGQPFAALVANPQFANLPVEQKKEVLVGLRQRMGGESSSAVNALTTLIRSTAGGALAGLPMGAAVPLALELSESGATKKSVLDALKFAAQNKRVKLLVGTGMAIGAAGGLLNAALGLHQAKRDKENFKEGLEEAAKGGEALAAASFGAIGAHTAPRRINVAPVVSTFSGAAVPSAMAAIRYGNSASIVDGLDPERYNELVQNVNQKVQRDVPINPNRLTEIAKDLAKARGHYQTLDSVIVNSPQELNIDAGSIDETRSHISQLHQDNETNIQNLNTLEQFARQVRDMKRGAH